MKKIKFSFFIVFIITLFIQQVYAETLGQQKIYQYKNSSNVTEFSDIHDTKKSLIREFTIKGPSESQKQSGLDRMNEFQRYNEDFNKRYYDEIKRQHDAQNKKSKQNKEIAKKKKEAHDKFIENTRSKHKRRKHLRRDRIREKKGKPAHP